MQDAPYRSIPLHDRAGRVKAVALVDAGDYAKFGGHRWHVSHGYAARTLWNVEGRKRGTAWLHREIMGLKHRDGKEVDHIDRDPLNNRRSNLRVVSHADNQRNMSSQAGSTSRHRGVWWDKVNSKWAARANLAGVAYNFGRFADEDDAGRAVNAFWVERGHPAPNDV
jgi:hypothetical protein